MDALTILGGLNSALSLAREAKTNTDLREALADARDRALDLRETLQDQQDEIRSLREQLATRETLTFDRGTNVYRDSDGAPFCPKCFDGDGKACRMEDRSDEHFWMCLTCKQIVGRPGPAPSLPSPEEPYY